MSGHVQDLWTRTVTDENGRKTKVRTDRYGKGKRWQGRAIIDGRDKARMFDSKETARAWVARQTVNPDRPRPKVIFGDYFETWAAARALRYRDNSIRNIDAAWRYRIQPTLGRLPIADITPADIQHAVIEWAANHKPSTVNVTYGYVSTVLKSAVDDGLIDRTPCRNIGLPERDQGRITLLTPHQVTEIRGNLPEAYRPAVTLDVATGLRIGELAGLTYDRLADKVIRVDRQLVGHDGADPVFGPPKSRRSNRDVTVGAKAWDAIQEHIRANPNNAHDLVFVAPRGGPWVRDRASRAWREAIAGMGLHPRSGWHDLRHLHASALIAKGLSPRAVADRLGHANPMVTLNVYSHLWGSDTAEMVSAAEDLLGDI